eukprot:TRINITY_DN65379_c0_g1_i1.p1 TRINITY_DN65379_c0_g1~~TRINITY_DN65379_c0_g1_i1.p1  ORF type:complete len:841 (+),score=176.43 TRINITY_DN65379_c0_g1_i1:148-2670(+)
MTASQEIEALQQKVESLTAQLQHQKTDFEDKIQKAIKLGFDHYQELKDSCAKLEDFEKDAKVQIKQAVDVSSGLEIRMNKAEDSTSSLETARKGLEQGLSDLQQSVQKNHTEITELHQKAHKDLKDDLSSTDQKLRQYAEAQASEKSNAVAKTAKADLEATDRSLRSAMTEGLEALEHRSTASLQTATQSLSERLGEVHQELNTELNSVAEQAKAKIDAQGKSLRTEMGDLEARTKAGIAEALETATQNLRKAEADFDQKLKKQLEDLTAQDEANAKRSQELEDELIRSNREHEERLASVLAECRAGIHLLECEQNDLKMACQGVGGIPTRQLEWRLDEQALLGLRQSLLQKVAGYQVMNGDDADTSGLFASYFSPSFEAAGARQMQLELRFHGTSSGHLPGEDHGGDCSLYLWAGKGVQMVFRLFVGNESVVLRHQFDGRSPCGMKRIGTMAEQVAGDGSLRIGIEVHEALLEHPLATNTHEVAQTGARNEILMPIGGSVVVQQYLNHRLLELIQCQGRGLLDQLQRKVDLVRSRATRRVQWRLENASLLRQSFAEGQPLCSTAFQAAGISGLQLVFYPGGCAGARPGFCSFFLSCPVGCTLRCWLWAGRWRREARPEANDKQETLGRVNFCRFENCVDPVDESVELALEIEEAHQANAVSPQSPAGDMLVAGGLTPLVNHATKAGSTSKQDASTSQLLALSSKEAIGSSGLDRNDVTTLKIQHSGGKPSAENVQQLPSIWTTQGFHSFGEINEAPKTHYNQSSSRANTCSPGTSAVSPPTTPALPRPTAHANSSPGSRKTTPRTGGAPGGYRPKPPSGPNPLSHAGSNLAATKYKEYM